MKTGIVFDIKEFAVFDGPGIRTTVFLKGCPLRCQWCHNPEGLLPGPQLLASAAGCTRCGACKSACAHETCVACGACVPHCPQGLRRIAGEEWTSEALACRLYKDREILLEGGGGVTFSGGEPLAQWDFVAEVVDRMPGMHTAVETSGHCADGVFAQAMGKLSLILFDLKLMDSARHRHFTGVDNGRILAHARMLREGDTPFILRMPLIPGVNDDPEHFESAAALIAGAKRLIRVEMLPYHKTAGAKYAMAGLRYAPEFDVDRAPRAWTQPFADRGIEALVL